MRIGIDSGGTFTDFVVLHDNGRIESFKMRSNPADPASVILAGIARAAAGSVEIIHGSTVATNALLERRGARTAFVTTAGFEDLIHIGRQNRPALYDLTPPPRRFLAPRDLCYGMRERTHFDGAVEMRPRPADLRRLESALRAARVESVAICLLHSYQNPENEAAIRAALAGVGYVTASHEICPEFREYERASTTLLNAYVGPKMARYLGALETGLEYPLYVMQSNGGLLSAREAASQPVRTVLSGPAGGVVGAVEIARRGGFTRCLGFDMGGTSTDVSLTAGKPRETVESVVDGIPVRVPMLDIHTVGAGGGSIARVDEGGLLRVGPESAGADPGPACYGAGLLPTVTDAHVVLGRIAADQLLGGAMLLDAGRAATALARLGEAMGCDAIRAAEGVLRVANSNMQRAIRAVSVERGFDPREFALVAFGGCGGLHACEIAADLGIRTVLAPEPAGVLSALGMLLADRVRDYAAGVLGRADIEPEFARLEARAAEENLAAGLSRAVDIRYQGQSYELTIPWAGDRTAAAFHREHKRVYGYANPHRPVEFVTVRVRAVSRVKQPKLRPKAAATAQARGRRSVFVDGCLRRIPVLDRAAIPVHGAKGPALVADYGSTTLVPGGWKIARDAAGTLILRVD
jgi:N-methylhydantoinase A